MSAAVVALVVLAVVVLVLLGLVVGGAVLVRAMSARVAELEAARDQYRRMWQHADAQLAARPDEGGR